jgi:hypothetical protein
MNTIQQMATKRFDGAISEWYGISAELQRTVELASLGLAVVNHRAELESPCAYEVAVLGISRREAWPEE